MSKPKDAFQLLMSAGNKRPRSGNTQQPSAGPAATAAPPASATSATPAGSKRQRGMYEQCPICGMSIPLSFLELHAASCLEKHKQPAAGTSTTQPVGAAAEHHALQEPKSEPSTLPLQPAPAPSAHVTIDLTQEEVPRVTHAAADDGMQPPTSTQAAQSTPEPQAPDAFAALMKGAANKQQHHIFYLEHSTGGWRWHWWQKGAGGAPAGLPSACWSALSQVREGGAQQGAAGSRHSTVLELRTNVPPGAAQAAGGLVDWDNPGLASNREVPPEGRWRGLPSGLKSGLQKCVRLGRAGPAVRLALHMLKVDAGEVLRRLPIICVEDGLLHPHTPLITWVMAAQAKGYQLSAQHVDTVLAYTHDVASAKVQDYLPPGNMCPMPTAPAAPAEGSKSERPPAEGSPSGRRLRTMQDVDALLPHNAEAACLVKSLLLRAHFGGMRGDVDMLRGYATYWAARFTGAAAEPPSHPCLPGHMHPQAVPGHQVPDQPAFTDTSSKLHAAWPPGHDRPDTQVSSSSTAGDIQVPASGSAAGPAAGEGNKAAGLPTETASLLAGQLDAAQRWLRFLHEVHAAARPVPHTLGNTALVGPLRRADVPLSAIDHHVSELVPHLMQLPQVRQAVQQVTCSSWGREGDPEDCLRSTIWLFRSSVNHRVWLPHLYLAAAQQFLSIPSSAATGHATGRTALAAPATTTAAAAGAAPAADAAAIPDAAARAVCPRLPPAGHGQLPAAQCAVATPTAAQHTELVHAEHYALQGDLERDDAHRSRLQPVWQAVAAPADSFAANIIRSKFLPVQQQGPRQTPLRGAQGMH